MPTSVRVSVIVMALLAGLLLLNAGVNFYARDAIAAVLADRLGISEAEARGDLLVYLIPYVVLGVTFALASWFLARRQTWARWIGLAASTLVAMLLLISAVGGGGVTLFALLLFVLALAAVSSLLSRKTAAWIPRLRSRRESDQGR